MIESSFFVEISGEDFLNVQILFIIGKIKSLRDAREIGRADGKSDKMIV